MTLLNLLSFSLEPKPDATQYEKLLNYLDELLSVKDQQSAEIVKFLQAILDKLIEILLDLKVKNSRDQAADKAYELHSKKIQLRVFDILVAIFQIVDNQNKFASFRTVIDAYLSKNFCITLAHRPLLRIFNDLMNNIYEKYSIPFSSRSMNQSTFCNNSIRQRHSVQSNGTALSSHGSDVFDWNGLNDPENDNYLNTIKSMEYIFKFAFRSRELLSQFYK